MTFAVYLTNQDGLRLTLHVAALCDNDACRIAVERANSDPEHGRYGPWTSGYSTRAS